jgi:hypothetical protein
MLPSPVLVVSRRPTASIRRLPVQRFVRLGLVLSATLVLAGLAVGGAAADSQRKLIDSQLVGLPDALKSQTLLGVPAGGLPWRIDSGRARLFADGRLDVEVDGLVLDAGAREGTNPIPNGRAIVSCDGAVAAMSAVVPFSATGDAVVEDQVPLPGVCVAPTIFFAGVPAPNAVAWFAVTGFSR